MVLRKNHNWLIFPALFMLLGVSGGCIFSPRDPEPPGSGESISYLDPITPANVWANLEISLRHSDSAGWDVALSPDFIYLPDSEVENQYPGFFDSWNKEREMGFITGMYDSGVAIAAEMRDEDFVDPGNSGTEAIWQGVIYYLSLDSGGGTPLKYRASAEIVFRLEDSFWYVYSWEDMQGQSDPDDSAVLLSSMGVLRATFGSKNSFNMLK
jgi:hypothetical protein